MHVNLTREDGGFNPIIKRCYFEVFSRYISANDKSLEILSQCYQQHNEQVQHYFQQRTSDFLSIDISEHDSYGKLLTFLSLDKNSKTNSGFKKLNVGGKVTAWKDIESALKVDSTNKGRVTKLPYMLSE